MFAFDCVHVRVKLDRRLAKLVTSDLGLCSTCLCEAEWQFSCRNDCPMGRL